MKLSRLKSVLWNWFRQKAFEACRSFYKKCRYTGMWPWKLHVFTAALSVEMEREKERTSFTSYTKPMRWRMKESFNAWRWIRRIEFISIELTEERIWNAEKRRYEAQIPLLILLKINTAESWQCSEHFWNKATSNEYRRETWDLKRLSFALL